MMEGGFNLDPNMLVNALSKDNDNNGLGGNGLLWIFLLILFGGGGFGGGFGNRGAGTLINDAAIQGQVEAALAKAQAEGCSDQLILTAIGGNKEAISSLGSYLGVEVNQIQNGITSLSNGLCELGYRMGQDTASVISQITAGNTAISRQLADCCCATQRAIDGVNYNIATANAELSKQLSDCCCATQRAIDGTNYNMATGFAGLQNNIDKSFCALEREVERKIDYQSMEMRAGFQGIRDYMSAEKIESLQKELQSAQFQLSQNAQTQALKDFYCNPCCGPCFPCPGVATTVR